MYSLAMVTLVVDGVMISYLILSGMYRPLLLLVMLQGLWMKFSGWLKDHEKTFLLLLVVCKQKKISYSYLGPGAFPMHFSGIFQTYASIFEILTPPIFL